METKQEYIISEYAEWLGTLKWTYYATLTFRLEIKDSIRAFHHFERLLKKMRAKHAFVVAEWFKTWKDIHLHSLICVTDMFRWKSYHKWWDIHYGISWWQVYEKKKGAKYYLAKYITKDVADWHFWIELKSNI